MSRPVLYRAIAIFALFIAACGSDEATPSNNPNNVNNAGDMASSGDMEVDETPDQNPGMDMMAEADMTNMPDTGTADVGARDLSSGDMGEPDSGSQACTIGINTENTPTDTCLHGAADWLAFKWTAPENINEVDSIELFTDDGEGALLADDGGQPGVVLFEGMLSAADGDGWRTLEASTPVELTGGATYWIAENVTNCSVADAGPELEYRSADSLNGPWSGPFMAHSWTAKVNGTCE